MKKIILNTLFIICLGNICMAQKMRALTTKEENYYKRAAQFIKDIIPQNDFEDWSVYSKDDRNYYERIAEITPKDIGPYQYKYKIVFVLNPEGINKKLEEIQKKIENEKDEKKLLSYISDLNNISTNSQVSISVILNTNYISVSDCIGNHKKVQYINSVYKWGVDLKYGVQTKNNNGTSPLCAEKTVVIYGTGKDFKYFPHNDGNGGQLLSEFPLKKEVVVNDFTMQNIVFNIEGTPENVEYFLSKVNWKLIKKQIIP